MSVHRRLLSFALLLLAAGAARVCIAEPRRAAATVLPAPDTVLVAARELKRGAVLRAADIDTVIRAATGAARRVGGTTELPEPGWIVRRLVHKGEPLRAPAVAPPALITAGASVTLVWEVAGLRLTRQGTAIGAAYRGQPVVVRVDATRRFTGIATAPGTVEVSPP